ncbi:MAG: hypothetical protein ACX93T_00625 [Bacteroidota bacterium]
MLLQGCSRPECNMMEPISARDEAGKPQPLSPTPDHSIERSVGLNGSSRTVLHYVHCKKMDRNR